MAVTLDSCDSFVPRHVGPDEQDIAEMLRSLGLSSLEQHTAAALIAEWTHPYSREKAAYPLPYLREGKFWPAVGRLNNVLGDRKLFCTCPPLKGPPEERS